MSESQIDRIESKIDRLASDVGTLKSDVSSIKTDVSSLQAGQARLEVRMDKLEISQEYLVEAVKQVAESHEATQILAKKWIAEERERTDRRLDPLELTVRDHSAIFRKHHLIP